MASLALELHKKGLILTGGTYAVRELLREKGGRWEPLARGWVFPADAHLAGAKGELLSALRGRGVDVEDHAQADLSLDPCEKGLVATGSTYPVREILRELHGVWDAALKGWVFEHARRAELSAALRSSGMVRVTRGAAGGVPPPAALTSGAGARSVADATPESKEAQAGRSSQSVALLSPMPLQKKASDLRVTETAQRKHRCEQSANGNHVGISTETKKRRLSCKQSGAHIATESVTKRRKVVETKSKIMETLTITVKRVRTK